MGRFAVAIFVGCFLVAPVLAEQPSKDDQVLDLVFPRQNESRPNVFVFWLRFEPGIDPRAGFDSQIKVALVRNHPPIVGYASADRIVWSFLGNAFRANPTARPGELANKIIVRRKTLNVPPEQAMNWQQGLLHAIDEELSAFPGPAAKEYRTGEATVTLDAPIYDVWYSQFPAKFHYRGGDSFMKWAEGFRSEIIALAKNAK